MTEIIHTIEVKIEIENGSGNRIKWFTQTHDLYDLSGI